MAQMLVSCRSVKCLWSGGDGLLQITSLLMDSKRWKSLGTVVPAGCVNGCGTTARGLKIPFPVVPNSTSDFPPSVLLKKHLAGQRFSSVTLWLQALDTHFFHAEIQGLTPQRYKFLNVSGDHAEVWCVPSAVHVPCTDQSQNKVCYLAV